MRIAKHPARADNEDEQNNRDRGWRADKSAMGTINRNTIQIRRGGPQMIYNEVWKNQAIPRRRLLMPYRIRQIAPESKYCHQVSLAALHRFFALERLLAIVEAEPTGEKRERRLNLVCTIFILIAQALLTSQNLREVMASLLHPLRMLWPV